MTTDRTGKTQEFGSIRVDFFECSVPAMAIAFASAEARELITVTCNDGKWPKRPICNAQVRTTKLNAAFVACDDCIKREKEKADAERHRNYWHRICPERFRKTDENHPDFPRAIYREIQSEERSLFLFGPTGAAKTRVAMLLLYKAIKSDKTVGVLWPEKVHVLNNGFDTSRFDYYANLDVLLIDDGLLTACRQPKLIDSLKQLCDVRMRHDRPTIHTSQIGTEQDLIDGKEYGEVKGPDLERIKALLRRLKEDCKVVSFAKPKPSLESF